MQVQNMEASTKNLEDIKSVLTEELKEVEERKTALLDEINENLKKILSLKTPNE